jgi:hypothetical protein
MIKKTPLVDNINVEDVSTEANTPSEVIEVKPDPQPELDNITPPPTQVQEVVNVPYRRGKT